MAFEEGEISGREGITCRVSVHDIVSKRDDRECERVSRKFTFGGI